MKTYTPTNRIRSAMANVEDAGQIKTGKSFGWGLRDILRDKKLQSQRTQVADVFRARSDHRRGPDSKITLVSRRKGGFHATGLGFLPLTFEEVKKKVRKAGYTHIKMGAVRVNLKKN